MSKSIQFIRASKNEEGTQLWVTGEIGVDVRFADLQRALSYYAQENTGEITVNIYSHGGYLDDATAFYDWVADSGTRFNVRIWGTAMSAATVIAAAAGRDNIEIAANATWMIHETQGGTDEMRALGNDSLVRVYRKLTGMKETKLREMIAATTTLSATDAVAMGFAGKVMKSTARLAAMYEAKPVELNEQPTAMAETKTKVPVKLTFSKAISAAFGGEVTAEVDVDQATAEEITALKEENDTLKAQIATLEAAKEEQKNADEAADQEALTQAQQEAVTAKADLATAKAEVERVKAEIAELKKPLASKTVADNQVPAVGSMPGAEKVTDQGAQIVKAAIKSANPLQRAQAEMERKKATK